MKLMRSVRRHMDGFANSNNGLLAAKGGLELAFQNNERLLEVVTMRRGSATLRNMHIDQAKTSRRIFSAEQNGICVSNHSQVLTAAVVSRCKRKSTEQVVSREKLMFGLV